MKLLNAVLMTIPFAVIWYNDLAAAIEVNYYRRGHWAVIFLFFAIYVMTGRSYDAFVVSYNQMWEMVYSQMLAAFITDCMMFIVTWLLTRFTPQTIPFLVMFAVQLAIALVWSFLAGLWYFHCFPPKKTIVVWDMREGVQNLIREYGLDKKFKVIGTISAKKCLERIDVLRHAEVVFLAGVHSHDRNEIIKYCVDKGITAFIIPRIGDVLMSGTHRMHLFHLPMLRLDRYNPSPEYLIIKRLFDIVLSLAAIIILSPIMLITAAAIKMTDHGPVLYKQSRMTKDGRDFDVLKFRSMRVDAEKDGVARLSTGDKDDRITPVGHVIRKVRIDELPQLFNILKGDMTIVGPRPERREIAEQYEKTLPEFRLRLQAKAGLTGYAQVYGRNSIPWKSRLALDVHYVRNESFALDAQIFFRTIRNIITQEGIYASDDDVAGKVSVVLAAGETAPEQGLALAGPAGGLDE